MTRLGLLLLTSLAAGTAQNFSLRTPVAYAAAAGTVTAAQGDFNGDGKLDLVVGNAGANNIVVYLGNGDGTFAAGVPTPVNGCLAGFLSAGDFNRDGKLDLLVACQLQPMVIVLPGTGNGSFGPPIATTLPNAAFFGFLEGNFQNVAVGDFDKDGTPDLVIGTADPALDQSSFTINLLLSSGDGKFQPPIAIVSGATLVPTNLVCADFNRDGNLDLAVSGTNVASKNTVMAIFLGRGNGSFQGLAGFTLPVITVLGATTAADLNRDGIPDLIVAGGTNSSSNTASQFYTYLGNGDGSFTKDFGVLESNLLIGGLFAVDLRGTGTPDLIEEVAVMSDVVTNGATFALALRAGNGDGTFENPTPIPFATGLQPWMYGTLAGDWNGDGITDLAFAAMPVNLMVANHSTGSGVQNGIALLQGFPPGDLVVILNGGAPPAGLSVSKRQLQFAYASGGAMPVAQAVSLSIAGAVANWTTTADTAWLRVSPPSGSGPASLSISVAPGAMTPGIYSGNVTVSAAGAAGSPQTISVSFAISAFSNLPTIAAVVNGASFQPGLESGSWVTILGTNLSNTSPGRTWLPSEIVNGNLPTALDGTSVTLDGKAAYVYYISPTQINVQAPDDSATGTVQVVVTNNGQSSTPAAAQLQSAAPAFFLYPGTSYAIATHLDYGLVGNPNTISGTVAAHPGDVLILWATGFGPTNPGTPAGISVVNAAAAPNPVITIGSAQAQVYNSVISPGSAGLYQIAIQLPANMPSGDQPIQATVNGVISPTGVMVFVAQ